MARKPAYSAKPGQIVDEFGNPRSTYLGKRRTINTTHYDKYGDRRFSEKRRIEIKREFEIKSLIRSFKGQIKEEINLVKQIKR